MDQTNLPLFQGKTPGETKKVPVFGIQDPITRPSRGGVSNTLQKIRPLESWFWESNPALIAIRNEILTVAPRDIHLLIVGESGTGKEVVAREINNIRRNARGFTKSECPFVAVNSGAIPENLAESILFGHERGAFTSARESRSGKFELAAKGSLFLDEIQNLPLSIQAKLLRVLQTGEIDRLGSSQTSAIQAQVISASNVWLEKLVDAGLFRNDLYFRLNTFPIYLPPLRARLQDIPTLSRFFLALHKRKHCTPELEPSDRVLNFFLNYNWPGNIRELEHCLLFAALKCRGPFIEITDLPPKMIGRRPFWEAENYDFFSFEGKRK